ncbi:chloride channel protein [Mucilaginibacter calamicampi]|uniref:Chloride channel protein n=1 Tax=Mucilaginibacter calamicampi TaxID=1302352 RepID=A0ABW2YU21_9SPHI
MKKSGAVVRAHLKASYDRLNNRQLKRNLLQAVPFWIASVITGLIAVAYAKLFSLAEGVTHFVFQYNAWLIFLVSPACFVAAWWLVKKYAPYARGSGIPQVAAALEITNPKNEKLVDKLLSVRVIIVKLFSSLTMAIGGGAIGREGPTIQIAATVFRKINNVLPAWWPKIAKSNVIVAGAAAGLAAAFNTPLGGIVFAIEELTKTHFSYFKTAIFSSVIIAGLTAQGMIGPYLYLGYPKIAGSSAFVFVDVILVALLSGLGGSIMAKIILGLFKWKKKFKFNYQFALYAAVCAVILAALAFFIDRIAMGSGKELMERTLFESNKRVEWFTPLIRIIGPVISFTSGGAGGVFAPALSAGAGIGAMVSGWFSLGESNTNLLVLAGMVGFLTGVTRSPFTSAILVLEMTDRHNIIFHLILAGMVASLVALLVDKHSFYDHMKNEYIHDLKAEEEPL